MEPTSAVSRTPDSRDALRTGMKTGGEDAQRARFKRGVLIGSLAVFTLVTGFGATFPYMQRRRDELGCDAACIGSMTSASSCLRLVGAVIVGRLSDKMGRRPMLWLSVIGCAASLAIALVMDSLNGLWLSAIPSSLFNHSGSVLKALFADYANDAGLPDVERASAMGNLGMAVGSSFVIGPLLASALTSTYQGALTLALAAAALSGVLLLLLPAPEGFAPVPAAAGAGGGGGLIAPIRRFFSLPVMQTGGARLVVAVRLFAGLAFHIFQVVWSASLKSRFDWQPNDYAAFMGVVGVSYAVSQGFVAKALIKRAGGKPTSLALCCVLVLGLGRPVALWTHDVRVVYTVFCAMVMSLGVLNTLISSACANLAAGDELGGLFGMLDAVENCTGVAGPLLGGYLAASMGEVAAMCMVVACYAVNFALLFCFFDKHVASARRSGAGSEAKKAD